ncbi:MAG: S9 family peptidase [Clostridia bacterium]|nr:S9 family peptidase [Clostridia bacterium]
MRPFTTSDMADLACLNGISVSPTSSLVATVAYRSSKADGKWYSQVLLSHPSLGSVLRLKGTRDTVSLSSPKFSADGFLYLLSDASGEKQLIRIPEEDLTGEGTLDTTPYVPLTSFPHGITRFDVCGDSCVFEVPLWPEEIGTERALRGMTAEEKEEFLYQREYGPREITEIDYKRDETFGVRDGSVPTLCLYSLSSRTFTFVPCPFPLSHPFLSPKGTYVACHGQPNQGPRFSARELFVFPVESPTPVQRTEDHLLYGEELAFTQDEKNIVYPAWHMQGDCAIVTLKSIPVVEGESLELMDFSLPDTPGFDGMPLCLTQYGESIDMLQVVGDEVHFLAAMNGTVNLYAVSLSHPGQVRSLLTGDFSLHAFRRGRDGVLYALRGDWYTMLQLTELRPDGSFRVLWDPNPQLSSFDFGEVLTRRVPSRDGSVTVLSHVIRPVPFEAGKRYPAVLYLHGGPEVCYSCDFWHELQILAGAGFAVIFCDPRGSSGYGLSFCNEEQSWGQEAIDDMFSAIDDAVSLGFIDPERIGVTGGSYGGYMTCKLIMNTDRFRAAVGQRVFVNKATSYGTGDMGFYSARMKPEEVNIGKCLMERSRTSIIRNLDHIRVPLLLLHGYKDYRCSFEQSEQMFIGLHERHPEVPVRLVMFPEANHSVSRTGLLPHRQRHVQEMVDWFYRYLQMDTKEGGEAQ